MMTDKERQVFEKQIARILGKVSADERIRLTRLLGDPPKLENVPANYWNDLRKNGLLIGPTLEAVYLLNATYIMDDFGVGVDWALVNERAANWATAHAYELGTDMAANTQQAVGAAVNAYYIQDQTIGDLQNRLSNIMGPVRAETTAITEVTNAASQGELGIIEELHQQGATMVARWYTNNDEKVCPICEPLNKKLADHYEGVRDPRWDNLGLPAAHPRCRCTIGWEIEK